MPIVPVATVGGHDTLFVRLRADWRRLLSGERMRMDVAPITLSWPLGLALHITPLQHLPLPAKIRHLHNGTDLPRQGSETPDDQA